MNCEQFQERVLNSETPEPASADARHHLAECPPCRVWQRQLAEIEQQLPLLAVPPSQRKAEVVRRLLDASQSAATNGMPAAYLRPTPFVTPARDRGLLKASVAIALAAALIVFALGAWLWQHHLTPAVPTDRLAAHHAERDRRLREAGTTRAKVETLAELADGVHQEALAVASQDDPDKLALLAKFYVELVQDDLPAWAKGLPPELRQEVLQETAHRLELMESALSGRAANNLKPANKAALLEMALAARTTQGRLLRF